MNKQMSEWSQLDKSKDGRSSVEKHVEHGSQGETAWITIVMTQKKEYFTWTRKCNYPHVQMTS